MAIHISDLSVPQQGEKKIRERIATPTGTIEVYEATLEVADKILEIERNRGVDFGSDSVVTFDEMSVLKELFPLLTNIETGDLSDEELNEIIANPSLHLLIAQNLVAQIISEVNKLYAENVKTEIASAESAISQAELISTIPTMLIEGAKRNGEHDIVRKIDQAEKEIDEILENSNTSEEVESNIVAFSERVANTEAQIQVNDKEIPLKVTNQEYEEV